MSVTLGNSISETRDKITAQVVVNLLASLLDVDRIQLCIMQFLWVSVPNGSYSKFYQKNYHKKNIPWNHFQKTGENQYSAVVQLDIDFSPEQASIDMPNIQNKYTFRVKVLPKGCRKWCYGTDGEMKMNVILQNATPKTPSQQFVIPVSNWNPQVMSHYTATLTSDYQIPSEMNQLLVN